jgi:hypothetical protein
MGTTGGNRVAAFVRSLNPLNHNRVDTVFAVGFVVVVVGAFTVFWTNSFVVAAVSLVGMSLGLCVMLVCMGFEDVLGGKSVRNTEARENTGGGDGFQDGDVFEESEGPRRRKKGPKRRV